MKNLNQIKKILLDIFFPKSCLGCNREGNYLCEDCKSCIDISEGYFCLCKIPKRLTEAGKCERCKHKELNGIYSAVSYQNRLAQKLIRQFRDEPYVKELAGPLADLIISHFLLLDKDNQFWKGKILVPIPLSKREFKKRGFNPAEEIAKNLSKILKIPLIPNCLIKTKEREKTKDKKILLVNDIYTTGAIMEKTAKIFKEAGAKEVWGIVIARGLD